MKTMKLNRSRDNRKLLLRNLATSVILYESVTTTRPRGRAVSAVVDRLIQIAINEDALLARRKLMTYLTNEQATTKVLNELVKRYEKDSSGFTRRITIPPRKGDGAPQVVVQLTKTVLVPTDKAEITPEKKGKKVDEMTNKKEEITHETN